jgi:hypothetical protein
LENEIWEALKHQVTDQGRKINIEILAVIFEFLWVFDDPELGITI